MKEEKSIRNWTVVDIGKYQGKTLPQILFKDPDWFFWSVEEDIFNQEPLREEQIELFKKASNIKIPESYGENSVAAYFYYPGSGKFNGMIIMNKDEVEKKKYIECTKNVIDLSFVRRLSKYDKGGSKIIIGNVKFYLFGNQSYKMNKKRCEEFFNDELNFKI